MRHTLSVLALTLLSLAPPAAARGPSEALAAAGDRAVAPQPPPAVLEADGAARPLAPYLRVAGASDAERLPLEETRADVAVAGPIARVTVRQVFRNGGAHPIEAVYVFPASTRAAVHALRMRIGERTVEARIARRGEARQAYAVARDGGRRAALLEEERPNVFTMSVANVMPGERIAVELEYSELVVPDDGVYELVYPTVVGPRYAGGAGPADRWIATPYLREGEPAPHAFAFHAHLESAVPLRDVSSPSHALEVRYASPTAADVALAGEGGANRDLVLRWRLAGDAIQAGAMLLPGRGDAPGYFVVAVEPPARPPAGAAAPAREYVFLVDVSGSMHGFPLETAKALMRDLLGRLGPQDLVNVVLFAGASQTLAPQGSLAATPENVASALALVESQRGGGGTELMEGLRAAYAIPRPERTVARTVVVVTDGYVGVEAQAYRLVRERLPEANLFAFGIGSAVNRHLMEGLARAGEGEPCVVLAASRAQEAAERFRAYVERPVLTGIDVRFEGFDAREVLPARVPDLFARRPLVLVGQYRGAARGRVVVSGRTGDAPWRAEVDLARAAGGDHGPLRVLWARRWVTALADEVALAPAKALEDAITDLGLAHAILTPFTSFVAADTEVVNRGGAPLEVRQPLPLSQGVSHLAVGAPATRGRFATKGALPPRREERALALPAAAAAPEPARESAAAHGVKPATALRLVSLEPLAGAAFDVARTRAVLEAKLGAGGALPAGAGVRLKLTVNAAGRVVRIAVLSATDTASGRRLEKLLLGARLTAAASDRELVIEVRADAA